MTGGYSVCFRKAADLAVIHEYLNDAKGTAFRCEPGTIAWIKNMAIARVLYQASETIRRMSLQFNPETMSVFVPRWEKILKITPNENATMNERRRVIGAKFETIGIAPTGQAVRDFITKLIPDNFVSIIHATAATAYTRVPGGLTVPGGITIDDGQWVSSLSNLSVRVYQPLNQSDSEFYESVNSFRIPLGDFLPAYTTNNWGRFGNQTGTISISAGSAVVTGTGTDFVTGPEGGITVGEEIEFFDDANKFNSIKVLAVDSSTQIRLVANVSTSVTSKSFRRIGFFLDQINLDNCFLT